MGWQIWLIIGFLVLSYAQFAYPEKTHNFLQPLWGRVTEYDPLSKIKLPGSSACSADYNPVCGNGTTYNNSCWAGVAGLTQVTGGACQ